MPLEFTISFDGGAARENRIDFYDVAQALEGFQRSLALTTHLLLNGEVITKAPALKGARIFALPAEEGSWKFVAVIIGGIYAAGQAQQNSVIGHLTTSAYDYVISESLGFHVDFSKTLGEQYESANKARLLIQKQPQSKFDSVIEKCQSLIIDMHRPIIWSKSAVTAKIGSRFDGEFFPLTAILDLDTYDFIEFSEEDDTPAVFIGRVSSYNINTYKGRIYVPEEGRPIPFELTESARTARCITLVTGSLTANARSRMDDRGNLKFTAYKVSSRSGRIKSFRILDVQSG